MGSCLCGGCASGVELKRATRPRDRSSNVRAAVKPPYEPPTTKTRNCRVKDAMLVADGIMERLVQVLQERRLKRNEGDHANFEKSTGNKLEGTKSGSRAAFKHGDRNNSGERGGHRSRDRGTGSLTVEPIILVNICAEKRQRN